MPSDNERRGIPRGFDSRHPIVPALISALVLGACTVAGALVGVLFGPDDKVPVREDGDRQTISIEEASNRIGSLQAEIDQASTNLETLQTQLNATAATNLELTSENERLRDSLRNAGLEAPGPPTPFPLVTESKDFKIVVQILGARESGGNYVLSFSILNNGARRNLRMSIHSVQITDSAGTIARPEEIAFGTNRGSYPTATLANGISTRGELVFTGKGALTERFQHLEVRVQVLSGEGFTAEFRDFELQD